MRILFLAEFAHYRKWAPKHYRDLLIHISEKNKEHRIKIVYSDDENPNLETDLNNFAPAMVFYFDTDTFQENMSKFNFTLDWKVPKSLVLLDMFYPSRIINNSAVSKMDCLIHFGKSKKMVDYYSKIFPKKLILCLNSRFINGAKFRDYKQKKSYDIIFYGTRRYYHNFQEENLDVIKEYLKRYEKNYKKKAPKEINFYPLRERLENLLSKTNKFNVLYLPEQNSYKSKIVNDKLSRLLNSSKMAVACSTITDICMHKYFEIAGSNCTILGDIPSDYQDLFKGRICEVNEFMSDSEILKRIEELLRDDSKREDITFNLYRRVQKQHSYDQALLNFNVLIEQIKNYKKI